VFLKIAKNAKNYDFQSQRAREKFIKEFMIKRKRDTYDTLHKRKNLSQRSMTSSICYLHVVWRTDIWSSHGI